MGPQQKNMIFINKKRKLRKFKLLGAESIIEFKSFKERKCLETELEKK